MIWLSIFTALWLGILTAISPCPLATNIAAISFISRNTKNTIVSGMLYAFGRTVVYVLLGFIISGGLLGSSEISRFLQIYMNEILGPLLIVLGLILLGWIGSGMSLNFGVDKLQKNITGGIMWAMPIGSLFALSFCPVSAGLFFGGLIPLTLKQESVFVLPVVYGIGTALPVVIFAFIMAFGSTYVGKAFNRLSVIELWIRNFAGGAFVLVGIYYCLVHIYGMSVG
ncbi:MAG: aromatic aminobenezylarsenical efflux permease ArsG family transporter [Kiritimatiellae bacterium]|jgi:cytochrome c-type biogenesis protein|nr:aromatic aminobenezylarsenical efflux permease ArsG family transporter [Kiritimatiellia bacterium]